MTARPIPFSAPMVRALLAGTKTQTRRALKMPEGAIDAIFQQDGLWWTGDALTGEKDGDIPIRIKIGDRLWVREAWKPIPVDRPGGYFVEGSPFYGREIYYRCDGNCPLWADGPWKPSIHLHRKNSRLTLTVTDVRVQRLQDISEEDAIAEGVATFAEGRTMRSISDAEIYRLLWEEINGPGSWASNPWVVAYTFAVARRNIDAGG
jgi:hypothetical protein